MRSARQIEHDKMIDGLGIDGVLDRYFGKADTFVLVSAFDRGSHDDYPYNGAPHRCMYSEGKVKLQKSYADKALAEAEESVKKYLIRRYEVLSDEQKAELPPFDTVFEEIKAECMEFNEKRKRGDCLLTEELCKEYGIAECLLDDYPRRSLSINNLYNQGKVKYAIDSEFIECCYSWLSDIYADDDNRYELLQTLMNNTCIRPLDYELRKPPYSELLPHLISVTPTFIAHCWGGLHKKFRFRFNEVTRAWLAEHFKFDPLTYYGFLAENECFDYGLANLTFYDGDKVLFYQYSHEREQYDYLERFDD